MRTHARHDIIIFFLLQKYIIIANDRLTGRHDIIIIIIHISIIIERLCSIAVHTHYIRIIIYDVISYRRYHIIMDYIIRTHKPMYICAKRCVNDSQ